MCPTSSLRCLLHVLLIPLFKLSVASLHRHLRLLCRVRYLRRPVREVRRWLRDWLRNRLRHGLHGSILLPRVPPLDEDDGNHRKSNNSKATHDTARDGTRVVVFSMVHCRPRVVAGHGRCWKGPRCCLSRNHSEGLGSGLFANYGEGHRGSHIIRLAVDGGHYYDWLC
jgi:hypothetical protein